MTVRENAATRSLLATHDWSATPLGPRESWGVPLATVVELVLSAPIAMALMVGEELVLIYNDAYAAVIGPKHPEAFGAQAPVVFAEVWGHPGVGDLIEHTFATGETRLEPEALVPLVRGDTVVHAYFSRSYSFIRDDDGATVAMLTIAMETTEAARRLQKLADVAGALAATLTVDDVARVLIATVMAVLSADQVTLALSDADGLRVARRVRGELLDEADARLPLIWTAVDPDSAQAVAAAVREDAPVFGRAGADPSGATVAALPIRTGPDRPPAGAIGVAVSGERVWTDAERELLTAVAALVGPATDRALLFEEQRGDAQLLQHAMLPQRLPQTGSLRVGAHYEPGVDGNAAGGDFYDAFTLPGGSLAVVLGDVMGHDLRAATVMGQVRAALRALVLSGAGVSAALDGLDALVAGLDDDELFVTALLVTVDPVTGECRLASAGHPPPVLRTGGPVATTRQVPVAPGPPIGIPGPRRESSVTLDPGDVLLLHSDGLVERRQVAWDTGVGALTAALVAAPVGDPRALCAGVVEAVRQAVGRTEDDIAVLAVSRTDRLNRSAARDFPAEAGSVPVARRWLADQLRGWKLDPEVTDTAILCLSELTSNALLHAQSGSRVQVEYDGAFVLVTVSDQGTRNRPALTEHEPGSSRGRGLHLIEALSRSWGVERTSRGSVVWFELAAIGESSA